jgi:hypothetical protein
MDIRQEKEDIAGNAMAKAAPLAPSRSFALLLLLHLPVIASLGGLLQRSTFRKGQQVLSLINPLVGLSHCWDGSGKEDSKWSGQR